MGSLVKDIASDIVGNLLLKRPNEQANVPTVATIMIWGVTTLFYFQIKKSEVQI